MALSAESLSALDHLTYKDHIDLRVVKMYFYTAQPRSDQQGIAFNKLPFSFHVEALQQGFDPRVHVGVVRDGDAINGRAQWLAVGSQVELDDTTEEISNQAQSKSARTLNAEHRHAPYGSSEGSTVPLDCGHSYQPRLRDSTNSVDERTPSMLQQAAFQNRLSKFPVNPSPHASTYHDAFPSFAESSEAVRSRQHRLSLTQAHRTEMSTLSTTEPRSTYLPNTWTTSKLRASSRPQCRWIR